MAKVEAIMKKMEEMASNYEDMKSKVSKFSKEPAGDPIKQPNNLISELKEQKNDYISQLIKIRATSTAKK
jgi:thiamine biosynthesis lipoprotein ApbE